MWLHFTTIFKISLVLQNSVSAYFSYEVYPTVTILKLFLRKFFLISSSTLEGFQIILFWKLCRYSSLNICVHLILWLHSFCCVFDLFQHLPCGNNDVVWNADTKLLFCLLFLFLLFPYRYTTIYQFQTLSVILMRLFQGVIWNWLLSISLIQRFVLKRDGFSLLRFHCCSRFWTVEKWYRSNMATHFYFSM